MRKYEQVQEEVHELAYDVVWREFKDECANAECDWLTDQLAQKLMVTIEQFVDEEHGRRERLVKEATREKELYTHG